MNAPAVLAGRNRLPVRKLPMSFVSGAFRCPGDPTMTIRTLFVSLLVTTLPLAAGCIGGTEDAATAADPEGTSSEAAGSASPTATLSAPPTLLEWSGYLRVGATDHFAHTSETEPLVEPLAKMGFNLELPEGTTGLEFRFSWPEGEPARYVVHAPDEEGMPTYMLDAPQGGESCMRIPVEDIVPGVWKPMAHGRPGSNDIEFTITSVVTGAPDARILDGPHGHSIAGVAMMMTMGMDMEMREPEECSASGS